VNVSIEEAFAEACRALGESIVKERILTAEVARLTPPPVPEQPQFFEPPDEQPRP